MGTQNSNSSVFFVVAVMLLFCVAGCPDGSASPPPASRCDEDVTLSATTVNLNAGDTFTVTVDFTDSSAILRLSTEGAGSGFTAMWEMDPVPGDLGEPGTEKIDIVCAPDISDTVMGTVTVSYQSSLKYEICDFPIKVTCQPPGEMGWPTGSYTGVGSGQTSEIAFGDAGGKQYIYQAGSLNSVIIDTSNGDVLQTYDNFESVAGVATGAGDPTAMWGFPGVKQSTDSGSGFPGTPVVVAPSTPADLVPVPDTGSTGAPRFCTLFQDKSLECYDSTAGDFQIDSTATVDANFFDVCDPTDSGFAKSMGVAGDYVTVLEGGGQVCHGQLGTGHQASLALTLSGSPTGMSCPSAADGTAPVCGVVAGTSFHALLWPDPATAPTQGIDVTVCDHAEGVGGIVTSDGTQACFALACSADGVVEEVCVDTTSGALKSHSTIDETGCNGLHAAYPNDQQIGVGCNSEARIFNRADMTGL